MSSGSMATLTSDEVAARYGYLRTVGRVTGREYEIEIWFAADPDDSQRLYLLSGGRERANWVRNLRQRAELRFRIGERIWEGVGRELTPDHALDAVARDLVVAKYHDGFSTDESRSSFHARSLPVVLELGALATDDALRQFEGDVASQAKGASEQA